MSKKNKKAQSSLPDDPFTFTQGSNWNLDGFYHDDPMSEGVEQAGRLPEGSGLGQRGLGKLPGDFISDSSKSSEFPTGNSKEADDCFGLSDVIPLSVSNLDWLSPPLGTPEERLPKTPQSLPELEEALSRRRVRGGLVSENLDLVEMKAKNSFKRSSEEEKLNINDLIKKAIRKSASGVPLKSVLDVVRWASGDSIESFKRAIIEDHGLAGNVFIRAAAYPKCHNGRWSKHVQKVASKARYVIASNKCGSCTQNIDNRCSIFKKEIVKKVPWKTASSFYGSHFKIKGLKKSSKETHKEFLRKSFLTKDKEKQLRKSYLKEKNPVDSVSINQAEKWLSEENLKPRKKLSFKEREATIKSKKAHSKVSKWRDAGLITQKEFDIVTSKHTSDMLKVALKIITQKWENKSYDGSGVNLKAHGLSDNSLRKISHYMVKEQRAIIQDRQNDKLLNQIKKMASRGMLTRKEVKRILESGLSPVEMQKKALKMATASQREASPTYDLKSRSASYKGSGLGGIYQGDEVSLKDAQKSLTPLSKKAYKRDVKKMLKQAKIHLNEGLMGSSLEKKIKDSFTVSVIKTGSKELKRVRKAHEGLAGHLYVQASVYATKEGTKGCEKGGMKHRSNNIPYVLGIKKCSGCVFRKENTCSKYAKKITFEIPHENPKAIQKNNIKKASLKTKKASSSLGDESFMEDLKSLSNDSLEDFDFYGDAKEKEDPMDDIEMDGFLISYED